MSEEMSKRIVHQMYVSLNETMYMEARLNLEAIPEHGQHILAKISQRSINSYDGTAMIIPDGIRGARVLDIGCGGGLLTFTLSKLVGPSGYVVGVDSSEKFIKLCKEETDYHMKEWGYSQPNCEFIQTDVEKLMDLQLEPFDIIVSNGLLCLIPNKTNIFYILSRLLKEGGEFYDSDIFSDVEQCLEVKNNPLYNCYGISDAMIWSDLQRVAGRVGFSDPYLIYAAETFQFEHEKLKQDLRGVNYACAVYRLIKLTPEQSEGGAVVTYKGTLDNYDESFKWDVDLTFKRGVPVKVDGYLASLLSETKYSNHFVIEESTDKITTEKNQNPFVHLKKLRAVGGNYPEPIYPMDEDNNRFFEDIIDKSL